MAYKSYKRDHDYSYTLGVFPTVELLDNRRSAVRQVVLHSSALENQGVKKIIALCTLSGIPYEINDKLISKLSTKEKCYAIGIFSKYEEHLDKHRSHIVLANPSDKGNLGMIIRTMVGFGLRDLGIIRPAVDMFDPKVLRGSMGAVFKMRLQYFDDIQSYMAAYDRQVYPFMLDAQSTLDEAEIPQGLYTLIFGNESSGLSDEYKQYGHSIVIPHSGEIDSLNLSVAVGIAVYHITRHRR